MLYDDTTPIAALSVADFTALIKGVINTTAAPSNIQPAPQPKRYVYGLKGICELFQCSHLTAQRYKDGIIKDACIQSGRKIIVDAELAMKLFKGSKGGAR